MEREIILSLTLLLIIGCGGGKPSTAKTRRTSGSVVSSSFSPSYPTSTTPILLKVTALSEKNPEYRWIVNGLEQNVNEPKITPDHFSKGDTVNCWILINGKKKKKIGPIIIQNSPPTLRSVRIIPSNPRYGTDLSIDADVFDSDRDDIKLLTKWFINDETGESVEVLSGSKIKAADRVYAEVIPFDGMDKGIRMVTDLILVQNTPPEILSALPSIEGRKLNYLVRTRDVDGDSVELVVISGPSGLKFKGDSLLWEAPEVKNDTTFSVEILAKDDRGGKTRTSFNLHLGRMKE